MSFHRIFIIVSLFFLSSCKNDPEKYIPHLQGYWEIDEVTLADGSKRDYKYNETIDYFNITDSLTGFRKKLTPNFDGTYSMTQDAETLKIVIENDSLNIYYTTPFSKWKETVIKATDDQLIIKNQSQLMYVYKRYIPLDIIK